MTELDLLDPVFVAGDLSPRRIGLSFADVVGELAAVPIRDAR